MDDTISRRAAIDAIESTDWYHQNRNGEMVHGANSSEHQAWYKADEILAVIENLPSTQSERKTGRWEYVDYGGFGNWHCTACRKICICNGDYDFCPNCGARMDNDGE